jgi:hypothetical protein
MDEAWEVSVKHVEGAILWPWRVSLRRGAVKYGPEGGSWLCWTMKGALRKGKRELLRKWHAEAKRLG